MKIKDMTPYEAGQTDALFANPNRSNYNPRLVEDGVVHKDLTPEMLLEYKRGYEDKLDEYKDFIYSNLFNETLGSKL